MAERHIGEQAEVQLYGREETFSHVYIQQIPDERGISSQAIGEGVVFKTLLFKVEQKRRRFDPEVENVGSGGGFGRAVR